MGRSIIMAVDVPDSVTGELEVSGVMLTTNNSGIVSPERRYKSRPMSPMDICQLFDQLCRGGLVEVQVMAPSENGEKVVTWAKLQPIKKRVLLPEEKEKIAKPRLILPREGLDG